MESSNTGEGSIAMQDHYRNSQLRHVRNTANRLLYQKLDVNAIDVDFYHQYDRISQEPSDNNQPYHGYLQLPDLNKENIESDSHDYLKLHGSVKTNERPGNGEFDPNNLNHLKDDPQIKHSNGSDRERDIIALYSIRLNENIYTEIEETAFSSNKVENTKRVSKPITEKAVCLSWKQRCLLTLLLAGIAITMAIGTTIYIFVNKDSQKESFITTTALTSTMVKTISSSSKDQITSFTVPPTKMFETVSSELVTLSDMTAATEKIQLNVSGIFCENELKATLCSRSEVVMRCNFTAPEQTDNILIQIHHNSDFKNGSYLGVLLYLNGTMLQTFVSNKDIDVAISSEDIEMTFKNVSISMGGYYHVSFIEINYISGEMEQHYTSKTYFNVTRPPDNPTLTLNPDQVIGLVFDDGNLYRAGFTHVCDGNVGHPPNNWVIDILYSTKTEFTNIPDGNIKIVSLTTKSTECGTTQKMEFAVLFTEEMDGGKLRCRISDSCGHEDLGGTVSEQLMLIPRNYCLCAEVHKRLEHPQKCDVYVMCIDGGTKKYAFGKACGNAQCTNSEIGACSNNCSFNCSKDTLDFLDFCPTSIPTSKQFASVYCNGSSVLENTGAAHIFCEIDESNYDMITVTYRSSIDISVLAYIDSKGNVIDLNDTDGISITFQTNILTISLQNVTCSQGGFYGVEVNVNNKVTEQAEGKLTMIKKPNGDAALNLHPDQFADLETGYRSWLRHSCTANVGSPAGSIEIEILKQGDHQFRNLNVTVHSNTDETVSCSIERKVDFGISFTSDMDKAVIRCSITHELFPDDPVIYSNNETVSLLPKDFCKNNTASLKFFQHPSNCNSFIQCIENITYSLPCQTKDYCFGSESTACNYCTQVTCKNTAG